MINPPIIWLIQWSTTCVILSSDASSPRTNSRVHKIGLLILHLPWLFVSFVITRTTQRGRMQRKLHGFPYISSTLTTLHSIPTDSCFPALWTREYSCPATIQFLSLLNTSDMTSDISYVDPSPGNRTIYWLTGAWPRFRVDLAKQIPILLALSATVRGARIEVSLEVVWEGARTRFPHPRYVWWVPVVRSSTLRASHFTHFPVPRSLIDFLRAALLRGWTLCFCVITQYFTDILLLVDYFSLRACFKLYLTT